MMRSKAASSMQKTYDECYLICSTAIFFEGQGNEAEALRSWNQALEQINYFSAYKLSASYVPKTETEKALYESLREMELQCKERVNLLEALKQSRQDSGKDESQSSTKLRKSQNGNTVQPTPWLGDETIAPLQYSDLPNPYQSASIPTTSYRPPITSKESSSSVYRRSNEVPKYQSSPLVSPPKLPVPQTKHKSRSPSPDQAKRTMRRTLRNDSKPAKPAKQTQAQTQRPAPIKAAGLAWDTHPRTGSVGSLRPEADPTIEARLSSVAARRSLDAKRQDLPSWAQSKSEGTLRTPNATDYIAPGHWRDVSTSSIEDSMASVRLSSAYSQPLSPKPPLIDLATPSSPPPPPPHTAPFNPVSVKRYEPLASQLSKAPDMSYRQEYLPPQSKVSPSVANNLLKNAYGKPPASDVPASGVARKPVAPAAPPPRRRGPHSRSHNTTESDDETTFKQPNMAVRPEGKRTASANTLTPSSTDAEIHDGSDEKTNWDKRVEQLMRNLPKGIDEAAAKNILNEIVVKGDEVHWDDVAGLEGAKKALKEAVVYPFLRPDLFMGLREPARGMLLFGPPGTGKTMLARAVATESRSTFFAISASSLTSKWHGESEKLVRALFALAKALTPSIIFVDEIDSLLSSRGGGSEHEASRRSKTEFLIQWSDLQRAAAGKDVNAGDVSRVLVLAATNCPWDIDDAARRRFVRRQYIPLPESETREKQLRTLIGAQKHNLSERDIRRLVRLTDGYSGSDITALAKDAAMGPLRNLGEALLYTPMDQIRPISVTDFESSLESIRPSVSKKGLEEFEEWAREYGERGG